MLLLLAACTPRPFNVENEEFLLVIDGLEARFTITATIEADSLPDERWIANDWMTVDVSVPGSPRLTGIALDGEPLRRREWTNYNDGGGAVGGLTAGCVSEEPCERVVDVHVTRERLGQGDEALVWVNWFLSTTQPLVTFFPDTATVEDVTITVGLPEAPPAGPADTGRHAR